MRYGELFAGIGGMSLGLERAGMEPAWFVEIDPFCQKVLKKHWPDVPIYGDVREVHNLESVDLIAGGFPCQPVSRSGLRKAQDDERWLWPEFARVVREVGPRIVLVENTPGLLDVGMGDVLRDLADLGYNAEWNVLSADALGFPHRRDRVFLIAYPNQIGLEGGFFDGPRLRTQALSEAEVWGNLPEPVVCAGSYGVSERMALIGSAGNAVVPQVAEWIGRRIMEANSILKEAEK